MRDFWQGAPTPVFRSDMARILVHISGTRLASKWIRSVAPAPSAQASTSTATSLSAICSVSVSSRRSVNPKVISMTEPAWALSSLECTSA